MRKYASSLYSGINAWNWNTNCNVNNNNRNNSLNVWPFLELLYTEDELRDLPVPLDEWYHYYRKSRSGKMMKTPQVIFALQSTRNIYEIAYSVGHFELIPQNCTAFVLKSPKVREVIAASVRDKVIQSFYVNSVRPYIEDLIPKYSCSCQIGKGGLYAVQRACEIVKRHPKGYIFKLDLQNCFPSFDTAFWVDKLISVLRERIPEGQNKELLIYLTRVLYLTRSQDGMKIVGDPNDWSLVSPEKSLLTKEGNTGLAIGNEASQFIINFATSYLLHIFDEWGIEYAHYTDDTFGVMDDFDTIHLFLPYYEAKLRDEYHLTVHPRKRYFQPTKRGAPFLSAFICGDGEPIPSKRIIHNAFEKLRLLKQWAEQDRQWMLSHIQNIADSLCSYLALMRHYHSYKVRQRFCTDIMQSILSEVVYADTHYCLKVVPRQEWKMRNRCTVKNRKYRHYIHNLLYYAS